MLLDECVNRKLSKEIAGHEVRTVRQMGWTGLKNGALLRAAAGQVDVLVTVDGSLPYQQNVAAHDIAVIVLRARGNRIADLRPLIPHLLAALENAVPRAVQFVE